jgi:hypothetical protein
VMTVDWSPKSQRAAQSKQSGFIRVFIWIKIAFWSWESILAVTLHSSWSKPGWMRDNGGRR